MKTILSELRNQNLPIVFVTGVGQTWYTLKGGKYNERWNLIPRSKDQLLDGFGLFDYVKLFDAGFKAALTALTGIRFLSDKKAVKTVESVLKYCVADENGLLPDKVDVRYYGPRSFSELKHVEFETGEIKENPDVSLLERLYQDIQCKRFVSDYGEENLFCFNYQTFSNLYGNADRLEKMIDEVLKRTGKNKVILVPMSMGATVVNAYLDKYCDCIETEDECKISKIISIVGAWNGSDGLSDLLSFSVSDDFDEKLIKVLSPKASGIVSKLNSKNIHLLGKILVDAFVEGILLKGSNFMALIPSEKFKDLEQILFTEDRYKRIPWLNKVRKEAVKYNKAQSDMKTRFINLNRKLGIGFFFIAGYNLNFGDENRDFSFLNMFKSADISNTDAVIQISSTVPGTSFVKIGDEISENPGSILSPDKTVDASTAYFKDTSWYFSGQQHEIGSNNTAIRLAIDIAAGKIKDVHGKYPQFNKKRNTDKLYKLVDTAEEKLTEENNGALEILVNEARALLESVENDVDADYAMEKRIISALKL